MFSPAAAAGMRKVHCLGLSGASNKLRRYLLPEVKTAPDPLFVGREQALAYLLSHMPNRMHISRLIKDTALCSLVVPGHHQPSKSREESERQCIHIFGTPTTSPQPDPAYPKTFSVIAVHVQPKPSVEENGKEKGGNRRCYKRRELTML